MSASSQEWKYAALGQASPEVQNPANQHCEREHEYRGHCSPSGRDKLKATETRSPNRKRFASGAITAPGAGTCMVIATMCRLQPIAASRCRLVSTLRTLKAESSAFLSLAISVIVQRAAPQSCFHPLCCMKRCTLRPVAGCLKRTASRYQTRLAKRHPSHGRRLDRNGSS
jgi:hypothetical protein